MLVSHLESTKMPHCFVINRMDRPGADFPATYAELRRRFGNHVVAEHAPIGQGDGFTGFVDVVAMQAYKYADAGKATPMTLPEGLADKSHEQLLEALADFDDHLMEEILEGVEPPLDEVQKDLTDDVSTDRIVPVLVASGVKAYGITELLNLAVRQFPDGAAAARQDVSGKTVEPAANGPVVAQVCKTFVHPQSGKLSVARVLSGTLTPETQLVNVSRGDAKERPGGLYSLMGKSQTAIQKAEPAIRCAPQARRSSCRCPPFHGRHSCSRFDLTNVRTRRSFRSCSRACAMKSRRSSSNARTLRTSSSSADMARCSSSSWPNAWLASTA